MTLLCQQILGEAIGGLVAGFIISGLFLLFENIKKQKRLNYVNDLIPVMKKAIQHRNFGEDIQRSGGSSNDEKELWVNEAISIEQEAIEKAKRISPASGAFVEWLDRIPAYTRGVEVQRWVSLLSETIVRLRTILEKYI